MSNNLYILTGGPGSGKTTLIKILKNLGYECSYETARDIIRKRKEENLSPRPNPVEFANKILEVDISKYKLFKNKPNPVFFDRSIIDALFMLYIQDKITIKKALKFCLDYNYNKNVFIFPPWASIYLTDNERDQDFNEAQKTYNGIYNFYKQLGFTLIKVPFGSPKYRADFILESVKINK